MHPSDGIKTGIHEADGLGFAGNLGQVESDMLRLGREAGTIKLRSPPFLKPGPICFVLLDGAGRAGFYSQNLGIFHQRGKVR